MNRTIDNDSSKYEEGSLSMGVLAVFSFCLFPQIRSNQHKSLCLCVHVVVLVVFYVLFFSRCNGYWPYIRRNNLCSFFGVL